MAGDRLFSNAGPVYKPPSTGAMLEAASKTTRYVHLQGFPLPKRTRFPLPQLILKPLFLTVARVGGPEV
jgi:hypothetical protein